MPEIYNEAMKRNEEFTGECTDLSDQGYGVLRHNGEVVFVPGLLPQEKARIRVILAKKSFAIGRIMERLTDSPDRVKALCPVFGKCGGCDLQHMSYPAQLEFKRSLVQSALLKIGGIDFPVSETRFGGGEYRYRNKLALPVSLENGETVTGFYAPHSHRIVATDDCDIQTEWVRDVISSVKKFGADGVRHIVVREIKGKFIFALVCNKLPDAKPFSEILKEKFKKYEYIMEKYKEGAEERYNDETDIVAGGGGKNSLPNEQ